MQASLDRIKTFVSDLDNRTCQNIQNSYASTRNTLHSEVKGMSEYISLNGRLYRYGFVSEDDERTRLAARRVSNDDLDAFRQTLDMPNLKTWDDITGVKLKTHLLNTYNTDVANIIPAPVSDLDALTLKWLQGVYTSVHRLNWDWGTQFKSWSDVKLESPGDAHEDALREMTQDDVDDVNDMLKQLTERALGCTTTQYRGWKDFERTVEQMYPRLKKEHGLNEIAFASLASSPGGRQGIDDTYMQLLLYLAHTARTHNFSSLPQRNLEPNPTDVAEFTRTYYLTDQSMRRDWGDKEPVTQIPATTTPSLESFRELVTFISTNHAVHDRDATQANAEDILQSF